MIRIFKYFIITFLLSYFVVWISDHPGTIKIFWSEYLIETNIIGLFFILLSIFFVIFFVLRTFSNIKRLPNIISNAKRDKNFLLGNNTLDEIAIDLFKGDLDNLEKNSRKIKKYFDNKLFSTFMLVNTALLKNDIDQAKKYLQILETLPKADYIYKRVKVLIALKENNIKEAKNYLLEFSNEYRGDQWFSEKLAIIHSYKSDWKLAFDSLNALDIKKNQKLKHMLANLKVLCGENAIDALKISEDSIFVLQESIKVLIDKNEIKKAANIIKKNWLKFQCMEIVEIFMTFKIKNISDSLNRYKIISRFLKKENNLSDETKLTLAYSAYHAQVWGESQTYLNSIDREKWDERVVKLYKKVKEKIPKIDIPNNENKILSEPQWFCSNCNFKYEKWQFVCKECNSVNQINWPKKSNIKKVSNSFFLQNPFRHFPQMK